jgi:hypothetical protein
LICGEVSVRNIECFAYGCLGHANSICSIHFDMSNDTGSRKWGLKLGRDVRHESFVAVVVGESIISDK